MKLKPLEPGEVKCDKCNGTGKPNNNKIDYRQKYVTYPWVCDKCKGTGKLDWIEAVVGKKKPVPTNYKVKWSTSEQLYGLDVENEIAEKLGKQLAEKIDKEILEGIINGTKTGSWGSNM